jgi:hypothetical protein
MIIVWNNEKTSTVKRILKRTAMCDEIDVKILNINMKLKIYI